LFEYLLNFYIVKEGSINERQLFFEGQECELSVGVQIAY
jgi:hypothetical protein